MLAVKKWNVGNRLKRVFRKFEADRSHPRGVNSRLKFLHFERRASVLNAERGRSNAEHVFFFRPFRPAPPRAGKKKKSPFRMQPKKNCRNFKRPFIPRTWLRSARNFGKTRFRRFPTFDFSTSKNFFWWNFRSTKSQDEFKIARFGGAMNFWALLAGRPRKMTPDELNFSSLQLLAEG